MEQGNNFSQSLAMENGSQPQVDYLHIDNWASTIWLEFDLVIYSVFTHNFLMELIGLAQKLSINCCLVQLKHVFVLQSVISHLYIIPQNFLLDASEPVKRFSVSF